MKRKLIWFMAAISALLLATPSYAADSWTTPAPSAAADGQSVISISELSEGNSDSRREAIKWGADYGHTESYTCHTLPLVGPCDLTTSGFSFYGSNLLVPCESAIQEDCISKLEMTGPDGNPVEAKLIGNAGGPVFDAVPELNLQKGGQISLWQIPGVLNSAGVDTYAAVFRSRQDWNATTQKFQTISFDAALVPYRIEYNASYVAPFEKDFKNALGVNQVSGFNYAGCFWSDTGKCGVRADFTGTPQVTAVFRASSELGGWFRGRLAHTDIKIEPFSKTNYTYSVTGEAVTVGRFSVIADADNTPQAVKDLFPVGSGGSGNELFKGNSLKSAFATDGHTGAPYTILDGFRSLVKDTAAGSNNLWSFESISENHGNKCLSQSGEVLGIVTTDATAYDGLEPNFKDGQLTYKVGGLHYMPDGKTLTEGTYDLVMRSDVARCLYGFTSAPISATVSVISDNGETKTAVTTVNEKDGWLHLGAYGFTFSSPTIQVHMTQAAAVVASKPTTTKAATGAATKTITCVKGKLTKKVTAAAPKCPAGYKKK